MRQQSQTQSPPPSARSQAMNPVLQRALANLDVQLEDELIRFRRQRAGMAIARRSPTRRHPSPAALDLISVASSATPASVAAPTVPMSSEWGMTGAIAAAVPACDAPDIQPSTPIPANSMVSDLAIVNQPSFSGAPSGSTDGISLDAGFLNESEFDSSQAAIDGYLESSEELLRSLAEEEAELQAEQGFLRHLLTPLGVGSMLLLLLSSAMLGYVLMNPQALNRIASLGSTTMTAASPSPSPVSAHDAAASPAVPQPDLSTREFKDLNLSTLGNLQSDATPLPGRMAIAPLPGQSSPVTLPVIPANPTLSATTPTTPQLRIVQPDAIPPAPMVAPPRRSAAPVYSPPPVRRAEPAPAPAAPRSPVVRSLPAPVPAPAATRSPVVQPAPIKSPASATPIPSPTTGASSGSHDFKVVTHYEGDRALEAARKAVPDAYVRNFSEGAKVQLGAYSDAQSAEARAQELRSQGIPAEVIRR